MKYISVLGSTGSIGKQTIDVVNRNSDMKIVALAAYSNVDLMEEQIKLLQPEVVCMYDEKAALELSKRIDTEVTPVLSGMDGLISVACVSSADIVVAAVVGMIGIRPVVEAIKAGKDIAFANKETLVTAGHIIMPLIRQSRVLLLPVDSEHSAIFQCMNGESHSSVEKILLTASGGPFRNAKKEDLENITPEMALKHPNWSMGPKITIDSSTMVNKGLEVMEAKWLFDVDYDDIQVVIQPQSIIHSMVMFQDGAVMAQLGTPDMRLAIQYALTFPVRAKLENERLDFSKISDIHMETPRKDIFPALDMAYSAGKTGGSMPTVFNAANEKAVALFLDKKIKYTDIVRIIDKCMNMHIIIKNPSLDDILEIEKNVHEQINKDYK